MCQSLELLFRRAGYAVCQAYGPGDALALVEQHEFSMVLLDMNFSIDTSGKQGMRLLGDLLALRPHLPVILMTGWATVQLAVAGMKAGARDFVAKPWDNKALLQSVKDILSLAASAVPAAAGKGAFDRIVTCAPVMAPVLATAERVAGTDASVLITGESGTGKELVAEAIHAASRRAAAPFVAVNLGGIPEGLFDSELFGHRAGAFTDAKADRKGRFALAEGGTLFLDEIGDLPLPHQVKLLRVLQERRYERLGESRSTATDVRIISATSRRLAELVAGGQFREDLLYRINLIQIHLPPLRERQGDIPFLAAHFLRQAAQRYGRDQLAFDAAALDWLAQQSFPGNVRQLQNTVERVAILCPADTIEAHFLRQHYTADGVVGSQELSFNGRTLADMEERMIRAALLRHGGHITHAAADLGLTRAALYRRLEKFNINPDQA